MGEKHLVCADADGYVVGMEAADIGRAVTLLGGGRMQKSDDIDFSVGVVMKVEIGSEVHKGDVLCEMYHRKKGLADAEKLIKNAVFIGKEEPKPHKIAYAYVSEQGVELY